MKQKILIYDNDPDSTAPVSVKETYRMLQRSINPDYYEINQVNSTYLKNEPWQTKTALLIFPGGRTKPHYENLGQVGNQKIIDFVHSGGQYLGLCAGGYYGAHSTVFEKGGPLEILKINEGPLFFYPGIAQGPVYELGVFQYRKESGARLAKLMVLFGDAPHRELSFYYNGGCYFHDCSDKRVITLATYADIAHSPAAIVECSVGNGLAILSGVHIEFTHEARNLKNAGCQNIVATLRTETLYHTQLFSSLLNRMEILTK